MTADAYDLIVAFEHNPEPVSTATDPAKKAGIAPGLLQFADGVGGQALPPYLASARLGGLAGHDLISVS